MCANNGSTHLSRRRAHSSMRNLFSSSEDEEENILILFSPPTHRFHPPKTTRQRLSMNTWAPQETNKLGEETQKD